MLPLFLFSVLSLIGPVLAARRTLNSTGRWQWGLLGLIITYWHGLLCLSGILTGFCFGHFSSFSFGIVASSLSIAIAALIWKGQSQKARHSHAWQWPQGRSLWALVILAGAVMFWNLYALEILPVRVWESLHYHVVAIGMWMQGEPLRGFESSSIASYSYPANAELLQLWWCIHPHSDRWIELPQWLSALALADSMGLLAADAGLNSSASWWAAAATLLVPVIGVQAATEQNDLVTGVAFGTGLVFLRRLLDPEARDLSPTATALAAGTGMGLALGSKPVIIPMLVPVMLWIAVSFRRLSWKSAAALGFPLLVGTYFYFDNLFRLGNPLYPYAVRLFGFTFFAADARRELPDNVPQMSNLLRHIAKAPLEWFETHTTDSAYCESSGFGGIWIALSVPAMVALACVCPPWKAQGRQRSFWALGIAAGMGLMMLWCNTPWTPYDLRYAIHIPALGTVAAAACWQQCAPRWRLLPSLAAILLGGYAAMNIIANNWNSPILRVLAMREQPFEARTYACFGSTPESKMFATVDPFDKFPDSHSVAIISPHRALNSAAFGPNFQRRAWMPDPILMEGAMGEGRWKREIEARAVDAVLVVDSRIPWNYPGYSEARLDLENPQRWTKVYEEQLSDRRLLAYRKRLEDR